MHGDHPAEAIIESILPFSRYIQRLVESEPELLAELKEGLQRPFLRAEMQAFLNADCNIANDEEGLHRVLRGLRKRVMLRLATRDLGGLASLVEVMATMTDLAELAISFALEH